MWFRIANYVLLLLSIGAGVFTIYSCSMYAITFVFQNFDEFNTRTLALIKSDAVNTSYVIFGLITFSIVLCRVLFSINSLRTLYVEPGAAVPNRIAPHPEIESIAKNLGINKIEINMTPMLFANANGYSIRLKYYLFTPVLPLEIPITLKESLHFGILEAKSGIRTLSTSMIWMKYLLGKIKEVIKNEAQQRRYRTAFFVDRMFLAIFVSFPALIIYWLVSILFNTCNIYFQWLHKGLYRFWLNRTVRNLVASRESDVIKMGE